MILFGIKGVLGLPSRDLVESLYSSSSELELSSELSSSELSLRLWDSFDESFWKLSDMELASLLKSSRIPETLVVRVLVRELLSF